MSKLVDLGCAFEKTQANVKYGQNLDAVWDDRGELMFTYPGCHPNC